MLDTSASMLIMSCPSCSLPHPLPKMTGLFVSITFWQEDQQNRSTKSSSQRNSPRLRNQGKSQSHTFALILLMSSQKRPIMFSPLIDPLTTPLNSRIPLPPRLRKSILLTLLKRKLARLSSMNILRLDASYPPNPPKLPYSSSFQKRMEHSTLVRTITILTATASAMVTLSHSFPS